VDASPLTPAVSQPAPVVAFRSSRTIAISSLAASVSDLANWSMLDMLQAGLQTSGSIGSIVDQSAVLKNDFVRPLDLDAVVVSFGDEHILEWIGGSRGSRSSSGAAGDANVLDPIDWPSIADELFDVIGQA
ncbi:MAG TPA: hypothetical protein VKB78_07255, partial [Pirellulales bacterium]|nr:hypothetical protein [Pirellulales bacterium]